MYEYTCFSLTALQFALMCFFFCCFFLAAIVFQNALIDLCNMSHVLSERATKSRGGGGDGQR